MSGVVDITQVTVKPRISVLIPVCRDWDRLSLCLTALVAQTWPATDFEIITINNDHAPAPEGFAHLRLTLLHQAPKKNAH